jgi:hypothetical protein
MQHVVECDPEQRAVTAHESMRKCGALSSCSHRDVVRNLTRQYGAGCRRLNRERWNDEDESEIRMHGQRRELPSARVNATVGNCQNRTSKNGGANIIRMSFDARAQLRDLDRTERE